MQHPATKRGYKEGFELAYIDDKTLGVCSGKLHYVSDIISLNDKILKLERDSSIPNEETFKIEIIYSRPWRYHYVYVEDSMDDIVHNIFYDLEHPRFNIDKVGYYHNEYPARCIGSFIVADGAIIPFKHLRKLDHSYSTIRDVYKFTRKVYDIPNFEKYYADALDPFYDSPQLVTWRNRWSSITFRGPYWGPSADNCNYHPKLLICLLEGSKSDGELIIKPKQTLVDIDENIYPELINTISFEKTEDIISPNRYWEWPIMPTQHVVVIQTNEFYQCEVKSNESFYSNIEFRSIGYVFPKYISPYKGLFPKYLRNIKDGLLLSEEDNKVHISPGKINPWETNRFYLLDEELIYDDELLFDNWNYIYIDTKHKDSYITSEHIIINHMWPGIRRKHGYYFKHLYCLGAVKVDRVGNILEIRSPLKVSPVEECIYNCNSEVEQILKYTQLTDPEHLETLRSFSYDRYDAGGLGRPYNRNIEHTRFFDYHQFYNDAFFNWSCADLSEFCINSDGFVYYESPIEPIPAEYATFCNLPDNRKVRFVEKNNSLQSVIDEWDLCDDKLIQDTAYFIAYDREKYYRHDPLYCEFSYGEPAKYYLIHERDDILLDSFGVDTTTYNLLFNGNPIINYQEVIKYDLSYVRQRSNLDSAKIIRHNPHPGFIHLYEPTYDHSIVSFDIDVYHKHPLNIMYEMPGDEYAIDQLEFWFPDTTSYDSTSVVYVGHCLERPEDFFSSSWVRLYDEECNYLDITNFKKIPIKRAFSLMIDCCQDIYEYDYLSCYDTSSYFDGTSYIDGTSYCDTTSWLKCRLWEGVSREFYEFTKRLIRNDIDIVEIQDPLEGLFPITPFTNNMNALEYGLDNLCVDNYLDDYDYIRNSYYAMVNRLSLQDVDNRYLLIFGNNYSETMAYNISAWMRYPMPHPYLLHDLVYYAHRFNIRVYANTEDYEYDLDFLCKSTCGMYINRSFNEIDKTFKEFHDHIFTRNKFKYNVSFLPFSLDGNLHTLTVKTAGQYFDSSTLDYRAVIGTKCDELKERK